MKRLLLALIALALGITGCGGGGDTTATPATTQGTLPTTTEAAGGGGKGDASAGKQVFMDSGCGGCHTLKDAGTSGQVGPNLDEAKPSADLVVERVTNGKGPMPPFKDKLSEKQIQDVAAYVSSVAGS